jgi:sporulation protein YlmC with PRC-barrel domain
MNFTNSNVKKCDVWHKLCVKGFTMTAQTLTSHWISTEVKFHRRKNMKSPIKTSLRRSLACAVSAALLLNAAQSLADDTVDAGDTYNQATPTSNTQLDHNISQPNAFGDDPADSESRQQQNRAAEVTDDTDASDTGLAGDSMQQSGDDATRAGEAATRGAIVDNADGSRQIQISTGENQMQPITANALVNRKIVNLQNKEIGEVEEVVQGPNGGAASLVVEAGGFMGIGEKEILVPLEEVRLSGNQLIWETQKGASELKDAEQYRYEEDRYSTVADD